MSIIHVGGPTLATLRPSTGTQTQLSHAWLISSISTSHSVLTTRRGNKVLAAERQTPSHCGQQISHHPLIRHRPDLSRRSVRAGFDDLSLFNGKMHSNLRITGYEHG